MLKYSEYKRWLPSCNMDAYNKLAPIFNAEPVKDKRANRIYLTNPILPEYQILPAVVRFLTEKGYTISNHLKGTCIPPADTDPRKKKQPIKIGKVLTKLGQEVLLKAYTDNRSLYTLDDNLMVVISRHPYDIIGMSTRRRWTSCHDLYDKKYDGRHLNQLRMYCLQPGGVIAYLVKKTDKNIKDPISRIFIATHGAYSSTIGMYGIQSVPFYKVVMNWVTKNGIRNIK